MKGLLSWHSTNWVPSHFHGSRTIRVGHMSIYLRLRFLGNAVLRERYMLLVFLERKSPNLVHWDHFLLHMGGQTHRYGNMSHLYDPVRTGWVWQLPWQPSPIVQIAWISLHWMFSTFLKRISPYNTFGFHFLADGFREPVWLPHPFKSTSTNVCCL